MSKPLMIALGVAADGVSFNGANESMNSTIAGDTTLAVTHASLAREFVKAGKLVPIIAFDNKQIKDGVYDLAPITDFGYDYYFTIKNTIFIRSGSDPKVIQKAYTSFKNLMADPEFIAKAKNLNVQLDPLSPEEIDQYSNELARKTKLMYKMIQENE